MKSGGFFSCCQTLAVDVEAYAKEVSRLEEMAQSFIAADHFDEMAIGARQASEIGRVLRIKD